MCFKWSYDAANDQKFYVEQFLLSFLARKYTSFRSNHKKINNSQMLTSIPK